MLKDLKQAKQLYAKQNQSGTDLKVIVSDVVEAPKPFMLIKDIHLISDRLKQIKEKKASEVTLTELD